MKIQLVQDFLRTETMDLQSFLVVQRQGESLSQYWLREPPIKSSWKSFIRSYFLCSSPKMQQCQDYSISKHSLILSHTYMPSQYSLMHFCIQSLLTSPYFQNQSNIYKESSVQLSFSYWMEVMLVGALRELRTQRTLGLVKRSLRKRYVSQAWKCWLKRKVQIFSVSLSPHLVSAYLNYLSACNLDGTGSKKKLSSTCSCPLSS